MSQAAVEIAFRDALAAAGLAPHSAAELKLNGTIARYRLHDDKPGQRSGWARLFLDAVPRGVGGDWRTGQRLSWAPENGHVTEADRAALATLKRKAERERKAKEDAAARRATTIFGRLPAAPADHPYLVRKRVAPGPCRVTTAGSLVVPVRDVASGDMVSLQYVRPDGEKRFLPSGRTAGGCCLIGDPTSGLPIVIAEGYATAASINAATGLAVYIGFNCYNLMAVARGVKVRHAGAAIIIAADNDTRTKNNPGLTKATAAAKAVGAQLAVPPDHGDFNDLFIAKGPRAVRETFDTVTPSARPSSVDEEPSAPDPKSPLSDIGLSNTFAQQHSRDLRYVATWSQWLMWNGSFWAQETTLHAFDLARSVCAEAASKAKAGQRGRIASAKTVAAVERLAKADRRIAATVDQWDQQVWQLTTPRRSR